MSEKQLELYSFVCRVTGRDVIREANSDYLFSVIDDQISSRDDFFKVMLFVEDLFEINEEKTLRLLEKAYTYIEQRLGAVSPEKYHGLMGWQLYADEPDVAAMKEMVKQTAVFAVRHDEKKQMTKSLFNILSFDGEDFMVCSASGNLVSLRMVLNWYAPHDKVIDWLSDKVQWKRWPEFLMTRVNIKTLSRSQLAYDLGVTGLLSKKRVVRILERDIADKKSKRAKDPVV